MRLTLSVSLLLLALPFTLNAQSPAPAKPGTIDSDGNYIWPNNQGRSPLTRKGIWRVNRLSTPGSNNDRVPSASAVEVAAMTRSLDALSALFQATPEAAILQGYWMQEARHYYSFARNTVPPGIAIERYPLYFDAGFFPFHLEEVLKNGQYVPVWSGETQSVYFRFNHSPGAIGRPVILHEDLPNEHRQEIYLRPRITGHYKGFPLYEEQILVLARPGRDLWSPVPVGRALRLAIPLLEKDAATASQRLSGLRKTNEETQSPAYAEQMRAHLEKSSGSFRTTNPSKWKGREDGMLRELQYNRELAAKRANPQRDGEGLWYWNPIEALEQAKAALAALSPAAAQQPACFLPVSREKADGRYSLRGSILPTGANPACEPLVTANSAYFDLTRPRGEPQLLIVDSLGRCGKLVNGVFQPNTKPQPGKVAHGCARHPFFWEQLDWAAVGAIVKSTPQ
jgi:hypothetical protein